MDTNKPVLQESSYAEKGPLYLLLGEVCETIQTHVLGNTMPSVVAQLAAQLLAIIAEPSHKMYGKVNKFLNKGPSWNVQRIVSYWIDKILLREPENDDGHDLEVSWLLQLLADGLRNINVGLLRWQNPAGILKSRHSRKLPV